MIIITDLSRTPDLTDLAARLGVVNGQPFLVGEDGSFDRALNAFLRSLVDPASPRPNTWRTYAYHLGRFLRWLAQQEIPWRQVNRDVLRAYYTERRFVQTKPLSARAWNNVAAALTRFYAWAVVAGEVPASPVSYREIRAGRIAALPGMRQVRSSLTEHVSSSPIRYVPLRTYLSKVRPAFGGARTTERDRAFADLLIATGMRVNEANSLLLADLPDPDAPECRGKKTVPLTLKRGTKGGKVRVIRVPVHVLRTVYRYVGEDRENAIADISEKRRPAELWLTEAGIPMKTARWHDVFRRASERSGNLCTPHMLRHAFAIHQLTAMIQTLISDPAYRTDPHQPYRALLKDPLRQLQRLLGHASLTSTFIYLDCLEEVDRMIDDTLGNWTVPLSAKDQAR
ncbi:tyrosine-type recombinase/integrase [Burkholderia contaminans]|uniref:tyrosine-type recombinase/integrase n=1 Tax=Burkholderia contaminans TaxID=488447 RepID=UPI0009D6E111|nr:tyrosine-type recombinase/integrase [Burkholderia contaminans]